MLGLGASDSIKYGRTGFVVEVTFEQRFERSVALALQISDKEHSRHRVRGSNSPKVGPVWPV